MTRKIDRTGEKMFNNKDKIPQCLYNAMYAWTVEEDD